MTATTCAGSTTSACTAPVRSPRAAASARRCSAGITAGPTGWTARCCARPEMEGARHFRPDEMHLVPVPRRSLGAAGVREPRRQGAAARSRCSRTCRARVDSDSAASDAGVDRARTGTSRATGRCTSTTTSRATTCPGAPGRCTRSWTTTATGWSRSATSPSSTRRCARGRGRGPDRSLRPGRRPHELGGGVRVAVPEHDAQRLLGPDADEHRDAAWATTARVVASSGTRWIRPPIREGDEWAKSAGLQRQDPGRGHREICEVVQRNLRSRVYDRGRYSAARRRTACTTSTRCCTSS